MSTNNPHGFDPMQPPIPRPSGTNAGLVVGIVAALVAIPVLIACAGILVALLLPAVQASREAARRMQCSNNLKQISLALHNYADANGAFPSAYTVDENGQPLHSWRTLILPYIEQGNLYNQIDHSKPWDDPVNASFANKLIAVYQCPSSNAQPGTTTYVAVVDPQGIFSGPASCTLQQVTDGLSNTLLIAETDASQAVPWMAPQDIDIAAFVNVGTVRTSHLGGAQIALGDGSVQFISNDAGAPVRTAMVTKDGGD